jgi:hypothetical protein
MSRKSIKQQVLDMCATLGCGLTEYAGSHFVVASKDYDDKRTWITCSHTLTEYIDDKPNDALRELLSMMSEGFSNSGGCDQCPECEICNG